MTPNRAKGLGTKRGAKCRGGSPGCNANMGDGDWRIWNRSSRCRLGRERRTVRGPEQEPGPTTMSNPEPSVRVNVDVANPGQFLACCGLLELADRVWPGAEGWFEGGEFLVACAGTLSQLLSILVANLPEEVTRFEPNGLEAKPIIAALTLSFEGAATKAITLDAWTKIQAVKGVPSVIANRPWNLWSGQQTSFGIWCALREVLASQLSAIEPDDLHGIFGLRLFQKGRFGFDPGPAWNALDAGFSPNEQNMMVESSAAVELLAAVGLQRFRPVVADDAESFVYAIWTEPLGPAVAAAAVCGKVECLRPVLFRGSVVSRGQYAALGRSFPMYQGVSNV